MNRDDGGSTVFLGLVIFGFFLWMLSKIATRVFIEIGHLFDALGNAATSFLGMLWALAQFAGILSLGVLLVYGTYKLVQLVKNSTAIMEQFESRTNEFFAKMTAENEATERRLNRMVWQMHQQLEEALKEPEAAPPVAATQEPVASAATPTVSVPASAQVMEQPIASDESTVSVLNRY